jgi:hypothetical protein
VIGGDFLPQPISEVTAINPTVEIRTFIFIRSIRLVIGY